MFRKLELECLSVDDRKQVSGPRAVWIDFEGPLGGLDGFLCPALIEDDSSDMVQADRVVR